MKQNVYNLNIVLIGLVLSLISSHVFAVNAGEVVGRHIFGLARDYQGDPMIIDSGPLIYKKSSSNESITINDNHFSVSIFDHDVGSIYISELSEDRKQYIDTYLLDISAVNGVSKATGAIKTSWNSVLFSENIMPDANASDQFVENYKAYFKNNKDLVNPYNYGWINELVILNKDGQAKVIKNYAMGRLSASKVIAMPDEKTFYILDSENSGNIYLFISSKKGSLSKGTLYALVNINGDFTYLNLGKSPALKMKFKLRKADFTTFFDQQPVQGNRCVSPYALIETVYGEECLRIRPKAKKYAGQFEPARVTALLGGKPAISNIIDIGFDAIKSHLILISRDKSSQAIALERNEIMKSNYIAKVTQ